MARRLKGGVRVDVEETREEYVAGFMGVAYRGVVESLTGERALLKGGQLEEFAVVHDGEDVFARTELTFRGRRFVYRRHIWPPDFPLLIKSGLYVTHLEERLLTGRYQPDEAAPGSPICL